MLCQMRIYMKSINTNLFLINKELAYDRNKHIKIENNIINISNKDSLV
jgi:hypothetical protein